MTPKNLNDFKEIYRSKFNVDLTDDECLKFWTSVLNLFKVILWKK
jgi:hypothetical protein